MSQDQVIKVPYLLVLFRVCICYAVLSVPWNLVVTCWERADLLCVFFLFLSLSNMCLDPYQNLVPF